MSKFHINKNGVSAPCRAKKGNCPLGGDEIHFKTKEEAQEYADKLMAQKHGITPELKNKFTQDELNALSNSEDYLDRITAIKHGFKKYDYVNDPKVEVRLAAANAGMFSISFMSDKDERVSSVASELYYKTPLGKLDKLYDELVPDQGKADTIAGELVRAMSRLNYRFYNDGDRVGQGYGKETCNSSMRYLTSILGGMKDGQSLANQLNVLWEGDPKDDYKAILTRSSGDLVDYIEKHPELKTPPNPKDSLTDFREPEDEEYDDDDEEFDFDFGEHY